MKFAWLTDIHLNFLTLEDRLNFYKSIIDSQSDAVLISGDIAEAPSIAEILLEISGVINKPIYFVLGNHDYYNSNVAMVRKTITELSKSSPLLNWLPSSGIHTIEESTILLGQDCWADGRYGDFSNSRVRLNDSNMIKNLYEGHILGKYQLLNAMQTLADEDAAHLKNNLEMAIEQNHPSKIILLIHIPPFKESCMHEGKNTTDDFLPFFSSKVTGDVLLDIAIKNQNIEFLVLCGHTHSKSFYMPYSNLTIKAGGADYMRPEIQEVIEI